MLTEAEVIAIREAHRRSAYEAHKRWLAEARKELFEKLTGKMYPIAFEWVDPTEDR